MKIVKWIIGGIACLLAISFAIAQYLVYFVLNRSAKHQESTDSLSKDPEEAKRAVEMLCGSEEWKQEVKEKAEKWQIQSYDGFKLYGYFLKGNSHEYALLCHGFTGTHREMM